MPSFDIVSELDLMEVENAVNQAQKELAQRFDFRGSKSSIELDKTKKEIRVLADDDFKLRAIHQLLGQKMAKRQIDLRCMIFGKEESGSMGLLRQSITLKDGLEKEEAKDITKAIRDSKLKVNPEIQGNQVRVVGKSIDELQATIAMLRSKDFKIPLKFINMRK